MVQPEGASSETMIEVFGEMGMDGASVDDGGERGPDRIFCKGVLGIGSCNDDATDKQKTEIHFRKIHTSCTAGFSLPG